MPTKLLYQYKITLISWISVCSPEKAEQITELFKETEIYYKGLVCYYMKTEKISICAACMIET